MNYLAHALLAAPTDEARLGSLLGDFRRGLDLERFPDAVVDAVVEHRAVDAWFDALPEVRTERRAFPDGLRRFAGILIDVFVDHFLVRNWTDLAPTPLDEVTGSLYRALETYRADLPPRLATAAPHIAAQDWLAGYGDRDNVRRALVGIDRRMKRDTPLLTGMEVLASRHRELERLTLEVVPAALRWTRERRELAVNGARRRRSS